MKHSLLLISIMIFLATAVSVNAQFINLSNGLDAFWEINESTGTKSVDKHGNNNNLTLSNSAMWWNVSAPVNSKGINVTPTSYYANSQNSVDFGNNNYSIGGWFRRTQGGNSNVFISSFGGAGTFFFIIYRDDTAGLAFQTGGGPAAFNVNKTMNLNEWYHIVMTKNGTGTNQATIYVNGQVAHQMAYAPGSYSDFIFFSDNGYNGGLQSQGFYYTRGLSQEEVKLLYNGGLGRTYEQTIDETFQIIARNESSGITINNYNVTIQLNNGTNYSLVSNGNSLILTNISRDKIANLTFQSSNFFSKTYTNWNTSINLIANLTTYPVLNVVARDGYNNSNISIFNITINGTTYSTTTGNMSVTLAINELTNITIESPSYQTEKITNWNLTQNLTAYLTQIFLTITAKNALTGMSITNFNIITQYKNYTTTTGSVLANLTNGTAHNITITGALVSQTTQVQYSSSPSNQTLQFSVYPVLAIRLFNESGATPFNTSITNGTTLFIYCENQTIQQGLTNTTTYLNSSCAWNIMRTYVTFGTETYYRTLKPTLDSTTIDFYLINLNTDTAVQKTFELNDLAGTYGQGDLIFDKIIGTTQVMINQDEWDIENKVISYFILNDQYTVELTDNSDNTRVLGPFIADATSNHVISVPTIPLYTDNTLDDFAWGYFFNAEDGWLYMNYASYNGTLYSVNFAIVNASNPSQVFYNNSFNTTNGSVNFTSIMNGSIYKTMLTFNHSSWSVHDDIKTWGGLFLQSDDFTGVDNIETWKLWFAIIIIIIGALIFNGLTTAAAAIWIAAMSGFFNWIGWLNIPTIWIIVIGVFALLVVFVGEGVK